MLVLKRCRCQNPSCSKVLGDPSRSSIGRAWVSFNLVGPSAGRSTNTKISDPPLITPDRNALPWDDGKLATKCPVSHRSQERTTRVCRSLYSMYRA